MRFPTLNVPQLRPHQPALSFGIARKFTPEELEQARAQMVSERVRERTEANQVLQYISGFFPGGLQRSLSVENARSPYGPAYNETQPQRYKIVMTEETYGPYRDNFLQVLPQIPGVTLLEGTVNPGNNALNAVFSLDVTKVPALTNIQQKEYLGFFEYFDNHFSGF